VGRIHSLAKLDLLQWLRLLREAKAKQLNGNGALEATTNAAALQAIGKLLYSSWPYRRHSKSS